LLLEFSWLPKPSYAQPSNQPPRQHLTKAEKRELDRQEAELKAYLLRHPNSAEAHLQLGNIYWQQQEHEGLPIKEYLIAIKLRPDYAEAYYNLGNVYFTQGEHEQAITAYKRAIELKPTYAQAYNGLGNALVDEKLYKEAQEHYKTALRLKPGYSEAQYNLCVTYIYNAQYQKAVTACKRAVAQEKDAQAYNNLGNAFFRVGKSDKALQAYRKALEINPRLAEAHFNVAAINLVYKKDKQAAMKHKRILDKLDPQKSSKLSALMRQADL
jgi:tetratricopeptide (TPR) repeat protein